MKKILFFVLVGLTLVSCKKGTDPKSELQIYLDSKAGFAQDYLIACAAGSNSSFMGNTNTPISIFYYVLPNTSNIQLFETTETNPNDFSKYKKIFLPQESLFQGQMGRYLSGPINQEKWVIVTYEKGSTLHISNPIFLDAINRPTIDIVNEIQITENGTTPDFDWASDTTAGNVIYFSLISNPMDEFISGTYTTDKFWTFYDLSNVTLNVTPNANPTLAPNNNYRYIHMGVDEDNWVRSFGEKVFATN